MAAAKNAYMKAPDPTWGDRLFGPQEHHLAVFDKWRDKTVRLNRRILLAGLALSGVGLLTGLGPLTFPIGARSVLASAGLFLLAGGIWIPWRLSFACHRMWGVYDAGFVAPLYIKGGWQPLVRWSDVELLRLRRMKMFDPKAKAEGEQFLIRAVDRQGWHHRIWESVLTHNWGFTREEAQSFKEGFMAAARAHLPPEKVVVEEGVSQDGTR